MQNLPFPQLAAHRYDTPLLLRRGTNSESPARAINELSQLCPISEQLFEGCATPPRAAPERLRYIDDRENFAGPRARGERQPAQNPDAVLLIREGERNNERYGGTVCCDYSGSWLFVFHSVGIEPRRAGLVGSEKQFRAAAANRSGSVTRGNIARNVIHRISLRFTSNTGGKLEFLRAIFVAPRKRAERATRDERREI